MTTIYEAIVALSNAAYHHSLSDGYPVRRIVVDKAVLDALIEETKPPGHCIPDGLLTWSVLAPEGRIEVTCVDGGIIMGDGYERTATKEKVDV